MSLQDRLKNRNKLSGGSSTGGIRDRFKKRSTETLEKTYDDREKQTKAGGMGKSIFNLELMDQFGIEEWTPHQTEGDHFFEVLPVSFIPHIPYHWETNVHFAVGFAKDAFICPQLAHRRPCYRCETQSKLYRRKEEYLNKGWSEDKFKNVAKQYYPQDRIIYLIWERTQELLGDEPANYVLKLWNAAKKAVHQEIQTKVRDKINRTTLDISDVSVNGEGRTVAMEVNKVKTPVGIMPRYSAFDLHKREHPIPDEILEIIQAVIEEAEGQGFKNAIEMFLHYPDYEEIKESMKTEEFEDDDEETPQTTNGDAKPQSSLRQRLQQREEKYSEGITASKDDTGFDPKQEAVEETLKEIEVYCAGLKDKLYNMSKITFKAWCMKNDYKAALEFDEQLDAVDAIVEDQYEKLIEEADIHI